MKLLIELNFNKINRFFIFTNFLEEVFVIFIRELFKKVN